MDGTVAKGYLSNFSEKSSVIVVQKPDQKETLEISIETLKALFFVKSFEGKRTYNEKKKYGISGKRGDRVFVKFRDKESIMGFLSGDVPWDRKKGYYLSKIDTDQKGFYIIPVDMDSNNIKVFVFLSAIEDVTIMI